MVCHVPMNEAEKARLLKLLQQQFKDFSGIIKAPNEDCPICGGEGSIRTATMYGVGTGELPCHCSRIQSSELAIAAHRMTMNRWRPKYNELLEMLLLDHGWEKESDAATTGTNDASLDGLAIISWNHKR